MGQSEQPTTPSSRSPTSFGRTRDLWARFRRHLSRRYGAPPGGRTLLYRRAVGHTRARVFAEAILALVIGFTLDDMMVLRAPGFLLGAVSALLIVILGSLWHGAWLAARVAELPPTEQTKRLVRTRWMGRVALMAVALAGVLWLVLFSSGVGPWAA